MRFPKIEIRLAPSGSNRTALGSDDVVDIGNQRGRLINHHSPLLKINLLGRFGDMLVGFHHSATR